MIEGSGVIDASEDDFIENHDTSAIRAVTPCLVRRRGRIYTCSKGSAWVRKGHIERSLQDIAYCTFRRVTQLRVARVPQLTHACGTVIAEAFIVDSLSVSIVRLSERCALDDLVHVLYGWLGDIIGRLPSVVELRPDHLPCDMALRNLHDPWCCFQCQFLARPPAKVILPKLGTAAAH